VEVRGEPCHAASGKYEFTRRLGDDWRDLADVLEIPDHVQRRFVHGYEGHSIWTLLVDRNRLHELPSALRTIGRTDLAETVCRGPKATLTISLAAGASRVRQHRPTVLSVAVLVITVASLLAADGVEPLEARIFGMHVPPASGVDVNERLNGCEALVSDPSTRVVRDLVEESESAEVTRNGVKLGLVGAGRVDVVEPRTDGTMIVTVDGASSTAKGITRLEFEERPASAGACLVLTIGRLGQGEGTLTVKPWCRHGNGSVDQNLRGGSKPVRLGLRLDQCKAGGITVDVYVAGIVGSVRALLREVKVLALS
jgi:hypothetical protein